MNVKDRLSLLKKTLWTFDEVNKKYGVSLGDGNDHILAQFRIWAEGIKSDSQIVVNSDERMIHRNFFELFLQHRDLIPIRFAAISWAMKEEHFLEILKKANELDYISNAELEGEFGKVIYRASFVCSFHRRLKSLRHKTFSDYNNFIYLLHKAIKDELGIELSEPIKCKASESIAESNCAITFDSLTDEPLCLKYQEFINTQKPISLIPDLCSTKTYIENESLLKDCIIGQINKEFEIHFSKNV